MEDILPLVFVEDDFVEIPSKGASFMMGSPEDERDRQKDEGGRDGKQVEVRFDYSFAMMKTEVTQEHWFSVTGKNPSYFKGREYCEDDYRVGPTDQGDVELCPNHPVERVSWNEAKRFIKDLNEREGRTGCDKLPQEAVGCYRLATEAEWEFAARGGTTTAYSYGNNPRELKDHGWYWENSAGQTHRVGLKPANPFGLFDMHGNVWEWVEDTYGSFLPGGDNPLCISFGPFRVLRGGSWSGFAQNLRSANRNYCNPGDGSGYLGFCLARTL